LKHTGQFQIIPAIDLKEGRCVRLVQGRKDTATIYSNDPFEIARKFVAAGAQIIHVVDLDGAFDGRESANRAVAKEIAEKLNVAIQFGGGVRTLNDVESLLGSGVARVVFGTLAAESPETLKELVGRFGPRVCVGIDARDGQVMTRGWQTETSMPASDFAIAVAKLGVDRIIYTDIKHDGMLDGPNIDQTVAIARLAAIRVTASGGVSSLDDIERLRNTGEPLVDSVIVGKALYERSFTLEEALQLIAR
jgi:phosphoribosylformimino-5-aminoimidazole carboxamide ribotide isomerase